MDGWMDACMYTHVYNVNRCIGALTVAEGPKERAILKRVYLSGHALPGHPSFHCVGACVIN